MKTQRSDIDGVFVRRTGCEIMFPLNKTQPDSLQNRHAMLWEWGMKELSSREVTTTGVNYRHVMLCKTEGVTFTHGMC